MERLGRTLEAVVREHGTIQSSTAAQLGLNLIRTIEFIHSKNILYVDVKPENFMVDSRDESQVYCVDFGIAERYIMATGKHKEYKTGGAVVGTPTFLSLNCHRGDTASRRDDVEALLHVLIYMMRGDLPWQQAKSDAEGAQMKRETPVESLCAGLPKEWIAMMKAARECGFEDKPNYEFFASNFQKLGAKPESHEPFQWGSKARKLHPPASSTKEETSAPSPKKPRQSTKAATPNSSDTGAASMQSESVRSRPKPRANKKASHESTPLSRGNSKTREHQNGDRNDDDDDLADDDEFTQAVEKDPHRRRRAAAKAVAAAAAASAAAKRAEGTARYNLRHHR
ncbi:hypothetical protein PINS_up004673 [Pythium insidiosum]|nr:hypothetical protein PINS_up004673 [Pythium insidiosum]